MNINDTRSSKDCTVDEMDFIASYQARLIYTRVDFLGTAKRGFRKTLTSYTHFPSALHT